MRGLWARSLPRKRRLGHVRLPRAWQARGEEAQTRASRHARLFVSREAALQSFVAALFGVAGRPPLEVAFAHYQAQRRRTERFALGGSLGSVREAAVAHQELKSDEQAERLFEKVKGRAHAGPSGDRACCRPPP